MITGIAETGSSNQMESQQTGTYPIASMIIHWTILIFHQKIRGLVRQFVNYISYPF